MLYKSVQKSLNYTYIQLKVLRENLDFFKANLDDLLVKTSTQLHQCEEFHKTNLRDFLKDTFYQDNHYINIKDKNDLVIYHGKNTHSKVAIIAEIKSPSNVTEMITDEQFNQKALQQLLFYYLQERIVNQNFELKQLIVTNIHHWFIFSASLFERLFYEDKDLVKSFNDFQQKKLTSHKTDFFYKEIADFAIKKVETQLKHEVSYFNLLDYQYKQDSELALLYKFLSPQHLLNLSFVNDSNTLDQGFYNELLHIIGLTEVKEKGKKLIQRLPINKRFHGSLLENSITQLDTYHKLDNITNLTDYGHNKDEQLFNIALELVITWVNRILFLKLLEAQLINYNQQDKIFSFLNGDRINNYNDLDLLFFQVLAKKKEERNLDIEDKFYQIPYLNSSLFEATILENQTIFIGSLNVSYILPFFSTTILKDYQGKRQIGELNTLHYLLQFLSAYDFSSDNSAVIQEENKTLINASVLGLIFEKINGYKDGSFFTPGFITMYMCRETIQRAIVNKFNDIKGWHCQNIDHLSNHIEDIKEANNIINSLKICDPAVGSGHFLVSALNEIIALKSYLNILIDKNGNKIKKIDYTIKVINDELIVTDEDGKFFSYNPKNTESQRIQETLFHEKQTIIENCLFGVDININSVKICRLRLWIELLKNAYYKISKTSSLPKGLNKSVTYFSPTLSRGELHTLETLPNIDINIKCGNSLISKFDLKESILSPKIKQQIVEFKEAIKLYRNPQNKVEKKEAMRQIEEIKNSFNTTLTGNDEDDKKLRSLQGELNNLLSQTSLFDETTKEKKAKEKKQKQLEKEINLLIAKIDDKNNNAIYNHSFEWRFEFPEILNNDGDFIGFDVVIGNPPYGVKLSQDEKQYLQNKFSNQDYQLDTYLLFIEQGLMIIKNNAEFSYIIPNTWLCNLKFRKIRSFLINNTKIYTIAHYQKNVFQEAVVDTQSLFLNKSSDVNKQIEIRVYDENKIFSSHFHSQIKWKLNSGEIINIFLNNQQILLKNKLENDSENIGNLFNIVVGIKPYQKGKGKPKQTEFDVTNRVFDGSYQVDETYKKLLRGSDINKYLTQWKGDKWIKYGDNLAEARYSANFEAEEKIIVRQTGDTLIATIDNKQFICMNNLHIITINKNNNLSLKYLLALINSQLLDYYHYMINPEKGEALAEVKKENLEKLPIKIISEEKQQPFIKLVTQIMKLKQENPNNDTSKLEREIDLLVYQLYGLTEEEINIIEG